MNVNAEAIKARRAKDDASLAFAAAQERFKKAEDAINNLLPSATDLVFASVGGEYAAAFVAYKVAKGTYLATRDKRPRAPKPATA